MEIAPGMDNPTDRYVIGFLSFPTYGGQMSDNPMEDLLVVMLDLETACATDEIKSRALAAMTRLGWTPKHSTDTWKQAVACAEIQFNPWSQPALSTSGRSLAIALEAALTRLPEPAGERPAFQTPWEFFEASFERFKRVAV